MAVQTACISMVACLLTLFTLPLAALDSTSLPPGLSYESRQSNNHKIHVLRIDPKHYQLRLVKAHSSVLGRETVPATALRTGAIAAINAGFFEIGEGMDGRPSGTLVIDGQPLSMARRAQDLLIVDDKKLQILNARLKLSVSTAGQFIGPDCVNRFVTNPKDVVLYNHLWARSTLTPYERRELLIDHSGRVLEVSLHGDNVIPERGWVLSYPPSKSLDFKRGQQLKFDYQLKATSNNQANLWAQEQKYCRRHSKPAGEQPIIRELVRFAENDAFAQAHARTAIGYQENGHIVMVVAEHHYTQEFGKVTLKEAQHVINRKNLTQDEYAGFTLPALISTLQKEFSKQSGVIGLTLVELAKLMLDLKCTHAINLDGGGSSSLFLNGQVVNAAFGDQDEALGQFILRPVSNSLVVLKRD